MTAPAPMPQHAPPAPGYASPIPVTRSHFGHALASEWTKIRSVRSTVWTLVIMFVLTVGVGLLFAVALSSQNEVEMPLLAGGFFGLMFGQLCVITLGVLVITSEYGTGMIRTTLTACPQRGRVLLAKAVVFFLLAFTMTLIACTLTGLIHSSMLADQEVPYYAIHDEYLEDSIENGKLVATSGHWLGATVGASLYVSLLGLLGLGVGGLLRHSAGAITTMLGVVLLPLLTALFMVGEGLSSFREKLIEYSPLNGLATLFRIPIEGEAGDTGWPLLGLLAGVTLAVLIAAYARLTTTDV
ncbi:ABC transporter permease [Streptomyces litchfieldiae]|uniref:ABC transporter permease n=1 Tax=Streptomyces litchfieldiae TaxID=3075543 RepID=A0ABU2MIG9_9ACTN|nr:ABC transporter permease [Streptomyces sp. DSM 44938]MDT0341392.1 ABC transporter permease [Streptomyces sp. DSM 44938]